MRWLGILAGLAWIAGASSAQTIAPPSYNVMPNIYNRQAQPLSPYLNMLRGVNPGVDYYYGVRPGSPAGSQYYQGMMPRGGMPFLTPQFGDLDTTLPGASGSYVLPPAGHPVMFGNYFGTAGSSLPGYGRNGAAAASGLNRNPAPPPRRMGGGSPRP